MKPPLLERLRGGLIVSCQAAPDSPMGRPDILAAFAQCAEQAGAVAIRANHGPNIAAIARSVGLPIIGIKKRDVPGYEVYITPEWRDVEEAHAAGAAIIALDATDRPRPGPDSFAALVRRIHEELGALVMADVATFDEGVAAARAGADIVATTLSGYTRSTEDRKLLPGPDLALVRQFSAALSPDTRGDSEGVPVICEGRVHTPDHARAAREAGAFAVVVGTAITAPAWIAGQFAQALRQVERTQE